MISPLALILLVDLVAKDTVPDTVPVTLPEIAGQYEQPGSRCGDAAGGICTQGATDRLVIQDLGDGSARLIVHSQQGGGHECHLDGVANLTPAGLRYCLEYEAGTCVTLTQDAAHMMLKVTVEGPFYVPFCGSRATLDELVFDKRARVKNGRCAQSAPPSP